MLSKGNTLSETGNSIFRTSGIFFNVNPHEFIYNCVTHKSCEIQFKDLTRWCTDDCRLPTSQIYSISICYTNSIVCFSETKFRIRQCCVGLFFFFNVDFRFEMFQRMAFKSFCKIVSSMSLTFNVPFSKSLYLLSHSDQHSHNPLLD